MRITSREHRVVDCKKIVHQMSLGTLWPWRGTGMERERERWKEILVQTCPLCRFRRPTSVCAQRARLWREGRRRRSQCKGRWQRVCTANPAASDPAQELVLALKQGPAAESPTANCKRVTLPVKPCGSLSTRKELQIAPDSSNIFGGSPIRQQRAGSVSNCNETSASSSYGPKSSYLSTINVLLTC